MGQATYVELKVIQSVDYPWVEINYEYSPMLGTILPERCDAPLAKSYNLDIEPNNIDVANTVTIVWEIGYTATKPRLNAQALY